MCYQTIFDGKGALKYHIFRCIFFIIVTFTLFFHQCFVLNIYTAFFFFLGSSPAAVSNWFGVHEATKRNDPVHNMFSSSSVNHRFQFRMTIYL